MLSDAGILRFTRLHDVLRMQQKAMLHAQVTTLFQRVLWQCGTMGKQLREMFA